MAKSPDKESGSKLIKPQQPSFLTRLRNDLLTGIVVAAPLGITFWLIYIFVTGPLADLDGQVKRVIPARFIPPNVLDYLPGAGIVLAIVALIVLGALAKNFIGRTVIKTGERLVDSMPVVRNLYGFFKNVFEMALQQSERSFKEVALVEYPKEGLWVMAFVVTSTKGEIRHKLQDVDDNLVSVFVPTTPNPTSGFLLFVPSGNLRILDMTVEEGAKLIFSAGLVTPAFDPDERVKELEAAAVQLSEQSNDEPNKKFSLFSRTKD